MTKAGSVVVLALAGVAAGCMGTRHASSRTAATPARAGATGAMMPQCPMAAPGAQVATADTQDGESITFTTTSPDAVAGLRSSVQAMADMHNRHHAGGEVGMHGDMHGGETGTSGDMHAGGETGMHGDTDADQDSEQHADADADADGHEETGGDLHAGAAGEGSAGSGEAAQEPGTGAGTRPGMHSGTMPPPSRAVVEDVDGGARVTVTPNDPDDLDRLRAAIRAHADRMRRSGTCEMMGQDMPQQQ